MPHSALYFWRMSEHEEDMNAFNGWDCFGATLMLGITPAVIHFATTEPHDDKGAVLLAVGGVIISLVVLAVALITRWRFLSKLINGAGIALTIFFICQMTFFWVNSCSEKEAKELSPEAELLLQPTQPTDKK